MDASADLLKVNHRLESRVPEIGLLGSEGGATSSVVPTPIMKPHRPRGSVTLSKCPNSRVAPEGQRPRAHGVNRGNSFPHTDAPWRDARRDRRLGLKCRFMHSTHTRGPHRSEALPGLTSKFNIPHPRLSRGLRTVAPRRQTSPPSRFCSPG